MDLKERLPECEEVQAVGRGEVDVVQGGGDVGVVLRGWFVGREDFGEDFL